MRQLFLLGAALCLMTATAFAQDPVKVDPKHYQVVLENDQVGVLKIHTVRAKSPSCTRIRIRS